MSQDRPAAIEVLRTVREFVDSMRTKLGGEDQYHAIVAAYLLGIVERELSLAPGFDRQEQIELARFIAAPVDSTEPLLRTASNAMRRDSCRPLRRSIR